MCLKKMTASTAVLYLPLLLSSCLRSPALVSVPTSLLVLPYQCAHSHIQNISTIQKHGSAVPRCFCF